MAKTKKNSLQHEKEYVEFLENQIAWQKANNGDKEKIVDLGFKLSKARLVLKLLQM